MSLANSCNYDLSWFYNNQRETYTDGGKLYRKLPFHRLANDTFSGYIWATLLFCHLNYTFSTGGKILPTDVTRFPHGSERESNPPIWFI